MRKNITRAVYEQIKTDTAEIIKELSFVFSECEAY